MQKKFIGSHDQSIGCVGHQNSLLYIAKIFHCSRYLCDFLSLMTTTTRTFLYSFGATFTIMLFAFSFTKLQGDAFRYVCQPDEDGTGLCGCPGIRECVYTKGNDPCNDGDGEDPTRNIATKKGSVSWKDSCSGTAYVNEAICVSGQIGRRKVACPEGWSCKGTSGACTKDSSVDHCTLDKDGFNLSVAAWDDYCATNLGNDWLNEMYCLGGDERGHSTGTGIKVRCPAGQTCSEGKCVGNAASAQSAASQAKKAVNINIRCTDPDGLSTSIKTTTSGNGVSITDSCSDTKVKEAYCEGGVARTTTITCPKGKQCRDGRCA